LGMVPERIRRPRQHKPPQRSAGSPCAARRVLGRLPGLRALGRPPQGQPDQPERRCRVSGVVLVPHLRSLITEAPPPGGANGAQRRLRAIFRAESSATGCRCRPCSRALAADGLARRRPTAHNHAAGLTAGGVARLFGAVCCAAGLGTTTRPTRARPSATGTTRTTGTTMSGFGCCARPTSFPSFPGTAPSGAERATGAR